MGRKRIYPPGKAPPGAEYTRRSRAALAERGGRIVQARLSADEANALERLRQARRLASDRDAIGAAIVETARRKAPKTCATLFRETAARDVFAAIGELIFGEHWRPPLAKALGINERTLRAWASGREELTAEHGVFSDLHALCRIARAEGAENLLTEWLDRPPFRETAGDRELPPPLRETAGDRELPPPLP